MSDQLLARITQFQAVVGVIGMGYVGLPLAIEFARAGFRLICFDIDQARVASVNEGISYLSDVDSALLRDFVIAGVIQATLDFEQLAKVDAICICVPTPLSKSKEPDITHILDATRQIAYWLHPGQLIVLESTTYPGTTEEVILPLLEQTGLSAGRDFFLAFSPERIDLGNQQFNLRNTPKVIGGITEACAQLALALYSTVVDQLVMVSSTKVAEMVKILENTFRAVNIGLVNEFAQIANILEVDIWEVIEAAATKPFGFIPFYPGPGLGGHCIPVDPHYLAWKLRGMNYQARFIELASQVNNEMPRFIVEQITLALNEQGICLRGAHILLLGVAYKRNINDIRESPALDIIRLLDERYARVSYVDHYVPEIRQADITLSSLPLTDEIIESANCVVILTDHSTIDYSRVAALASLVVDTRNITRHLPSKGPIWRLIRPIKHLLELSRCQTIERLITPL